MKKLNKLFALIIMFFSFFVGINEVKAIDCEYRLPFVGIDAKKKYVDPSDFGCSYGSTIDCSLYAKVGSSRYSYKCQTSGANTRTYEWYHTLNKWGDKDGESNKIPIYGAKSSSSTSCNDLDCATNSEGYYFKFDTVECPKYIVLNNTNKDGNTTWLTELFDTKNDLCMNWLSCGYQVSNLSSLNSIISSDSGCTKTGMKNVAKDADFEAKTYIISESDDDYNKFLQTFSSKAAKYKGVYLPLITEDGKMTDKVDSNYKTFRNVVSNSWANELDSFSESLKSACGDNWVDYINIKNYKSSFSTSLEFIAYGSSSFSVSVAQKKFNIDTDLSQSCIDKRAKFFEMFKSFGIFMYSIDVDTGGKAEEFGDYYTSFTTVEDPTEKAAENWKKMEWFYNTVKTGTDTTLENYKSSNEKVEKTATAESKVNECYSKLDALKAQNAESERITAQENKCKDLEGEYTSIVEENRTEYEAAKADVSKIAVNVNYTQYEPKCSDVSFLTDAWSLISLCAPFLIIIFGAFDFFGAVVAGDEERMRKSKMKFPKRLIAFLLFLIIPIIIKILLLNFGTYNSNNLTYLYCILSGDKGGDSGSSSSGSGKTGSKTKKSESDSKKSDTSDENSKSSSGSSNKHDDNTNNQGSKLQDYCDDSSCSDEEDCDGEECTTEREFYIKCEEYTKKKCDSYTDANKKVECYKKESKKYISNNCQESNRVEKNIR